MTDQETLPRTRTLVAAVIILAFSLSTAGLAGVAVGLEVPNPFAPEETEVVAEFERAVGLYDQSRVLADGVEVGEVTDIEVLSDRVWVTMRLDDVAIESTTHAILRLRSLIGERYIELDSVWTGTGSRLEDGDLIPMAQTVVPAEITDVLDEAARVSRDLDGDVLGRVIDELAAVVSDDGAAVKLLLDELADAGETVASQADDLDSLISSLDRAVATLAEKDDTVVSVLRNGTTVSQALLAQEGSLGAAVTSIDNIVGQLADFTGNQRVALTDLVGDLSTIGTLLSEHRTDFEQVVHYLPLASFGFARAINQDSGRWSLQPQVTGTLISPFLPNLNSQGGVGSEDGDNRLVPSIDYEDSPARDVVPREVDLTPILGAGPLLPSGSVGDAVEIDGDGSGRR